ncbi:MULTISPECIES: hypothetical protein [Parabacteroides]|uniref:hypothetical protein n=1 Tax=Parabacteroides leei TaxID=2939491 RepID=UPI00189B812C|nr:hypothetical protein [Parabacteroides goldsteinii]
MKTHLFNALLLWAFTSLALWTTGCSEDDGYPDVDGQSPALTLTSDHIQTAAGRSFTIKGTVSDKDGIAAIKLECSDLNLNKTIDLIEIYEKPLETYDLSYSFAIQKEEIGEQFTVKVTIIDVGGRSVSQDVLVTMDGDFENPTFTVSPDASVTVLIKAETKFNLRFSVKDDRALDCVTVEIPGIDGYSPRKLEVNGEKTFEFSEKIALPSIIQDYNVTITAADNVGNTSVIKSVISVSELQDFEKMYLADVATVEELNSDVFGVPMRIEHTGAYEYKANYYSQKANTEIFFLPQKSDFAPICFGLDPEDNNKLTDDPETAKPIVLEQANVYYEITLNTMEGTYAIRSYSIPEAIDPLPHAQGSMLLDQWGDGSTLTEFYIGYTTTGPSAVQRFTQDATNPHLFYLEDNLELTGGESMNFIIHNYHSDGWWNYCTWRTDNSAEPETFDYYGSIKNPAWTIPNTTQDNWAKPAVNVTGSYKFYFDAHLGRAKLVRVN